MRLLFIASDAREYSGVLRHTRGVVARHLSVDWAREGVLGEHDVLLVANGVGAARAAAAVDAALAAFRPAALVSAGYCGALSPALDVAGIVVGTSVAAPDRIYQALPVASAAPFVAGRVCSLGHVVQAASEKGKLHADGACAVEMEAAGVAGRAEKHSLAFYCIKTVTDLANETLGADFNAALRPDGHFDTISILGSVIRHPSARLPELLRLRRRCVRASHALGDFLAACRF